MSNQTSSMFLANVSIVDHAYIDQRGNVVGGSFNPSFIITGEVDPVEQVVVDFSAVKKQVKAAIDDKEFGFDHKLWFIQGFSAGKIESVGPQYEITTPTTTLSVPHNAVKIVEDGLYTIESIGRHMGRLVERELSKLHPKINIKVECLNSVDAHYPSPDHNRALFRYAHGLKDSTSWGCKNIAHGHLSYIQLLPSSDKSNALADAIAADLDDTIFINQENILENNSHWMTIGYTTERGEFKSTYLKSAYKLTVLETETTVEHLVDYVAAAYEQRLTEAGVRHVLVSEGLSKGAMVNLT